MPRDNIRHNRLQQQFADKANKIFDEANEKFDKGEYQDAVSKFSEAIKLVPTFANALFNRALVHKEMGKSVMCDVF